MDGLWNAGIQRETTRQAELSKHRLLRINLSNAELMEPGDASSMGTVAPPTVVVSQNLGPHFVLSSRTPDNSHTYGFEFCFSTENLSPPASPPYTVTIWELIGTSVIQDQTSAIIPIWASLAPVTVNNNELWHTFDVNACAIRFQIEDSAADQSISRSVIIALAEL